MKENIKFYQRILYFIGTHIFIFYILSFTWGLLTSFIGLLIMIPFFITRKTKTFCGRIYGIFPKQFGSGWGFEMGCFFFVSYDCDNEIEMNSHECGHGIQNVLWGPLMLFVISIPSAIRFWHRNIQYKKGKKLKPYDSIWFEEQASRWGLTYVYFPTIERNNNNEKN